MTLTIPGLHHVTAVSGPAQANLDYFTGVLNQRLVKKTVNFDRPDTYHLYYGNDAAEPGTILTFFPFSDADAGRAGPGMASAYAYAVPTSRFDHWASLPDATITDRFGDRVITLRDPDGAPVELVETDRDGEGDLDGFHSVTLFEADLEPTRRLLVDHFGYAEAGHETASGSERLRLQAPGEARGRIVDLIRMDAAPKGQQGKGTIHHVAFRARDDAEQLDWQDRLRSAGFDVTEVRDRQYFNAVYFREPGGVLFEIATDPPGFAVDEDAAHLGEALMLPPQYEAQRAALEAQLPPLKRG